MSRFQLLALVLAVAGLTAFAMSGPAQADSGRAAKCYEAEKVLTGAGTTGAQVAASGTILLDRLVNEGHDDFIVMEAAGHKVVCGWKKG